MNTRKLDPNLLILSEAIRTEGYIMKERNMQGMAISNKDINILNKIESIYNSLCPSRKTSKNLVLILYLSNKIKIKKIINKTIKQELKFHIDKNNRLIITQPLDNFNIKFNYLIITKNKNYKLNLNISKEGTIRTNSRIHSTSYATLQIYNVSFIRNFQKDFKIPFGIGLRKSYIIDFPFEIKKLSKEQIKAILRIVISCEGCVYNYKPTKQRIVKIKLASKIYLKKLKLMFERLGIICQEIKPTTDKLYILRIRRRKNLLKLYKEIRLISKRKQNILKEIVLSYSNKRFTHYEATNNYLSLLKQYGPINSSKIAQIINRNPTTVWIAYERLIKKGYITKFGREFTGKGSTPWIYKINKKGLDYLNNYL